MTPERFRKLRAALRRKQPDLTVLMDQVHKPHNVSAVLRSCDAVGVWELHAVWPAKKMPVHHLTAGGSRRWVKIRTHPDLGGAFGALRDQGMQVVAAHPSEGAVDFREVDYTRPTAILLGAELDGLSAESLEAADRHVVIPQQGLVASLNVSVAAALILFEAMRQREASGAYARPRLPPELREPALFEWAYPRLAAHCRRRGAPYPRLDEEGDIVGPLPR